MAKTSCEQIEDVVAYIARGYTDNVRRTAQNLPTPQLLVGGADAKYDLDALIKARDGTAAYAKTYKWPLEKYRREMNTIEKLIEIARESNRTQGAVDDLDRLRGAAIKD